MWSTWRGTEVTKSMCGQTEEGKRWMNGGSTCNAGEQQAGMEYSRRRRSIPDLSVKGRRRRRS